MPWWIPLVVGIALFALVLVAIGFAWTHPPEDPGNGPMY